MAVNSIPSQDPADDGTLLGTFKTILKKNLQGISKELDLPVENLLSPGVLKEICFSPNADLRNQLSSLGARDWQIDAVCESLDEAFQQADLPPVEDTTSAEEVQNQA